MDTLIVDGLIESLSKFHKLYDIIRVIDPETMEVIKSSQNDDQITKPNCYDFWSKKTICSNCVAKRASDKNETSIKIEAKDDHTFMITASPVQIEDKTYVFEMIKDITSTDLITEIDGREIKESDRIIATLNKQVITDDLTCLYNRRYINKQLPIELNEFNQYGKIFSLMMVDIDNFKEINDAYGHLAGDTVIQNLSKIMGSSIRKDTDWIARYGGEEFLIFLKGANRQAAFKIAESIRKNVEKQVIEYEGNNFTITISIGTYTVTNGVEDSKIILEAVDKNLYKAKNQGRNQTISS